jgi:hypothetical protein
MLLHPSPFDTSTATAMSVPSSGTVAHPFKDSPREIWGEYFLGVVGVVESAVTGGVEHVI